MDYTILERYGIDYKKGIARCLNDESFYEKMLSMFLNDDAFVRSKAAFEKKDYKTLFSCTHEMKGVYGNAELTELYNTICPLVEILRSNTGTDNVISELFTKLESVYMKTREGVSMAIGKK